MTSARPFDDFSFDDESASIISDSEESSSIESEEEIVTKGPIVQKSLLTEDNNFVPMAQGGKEDDRLSDEISDGEEPKKTKTKAKKTTKSECKKSTKPSTKSKSSKKNSQQQTETPSSSPYKKVGKKSDLRGKVGRQKISKKKLQREDLKPVFDALCKIYFVE